MIDKLTHSGCVIGYFFVVLVLVRDASAVAQSVFNDCDDSVVVDCVLNFVANRDIFSKYQCRGSMECEANTLDDSFSEHYNIDFCLAEDFSKRLLRRDWRVINLLEGSRTSFAWSSQFTNGEKARLFKEDYEVNQEIVRARRDPIEVFVPVDVWCLSVADLGSIEKGRATSLYWMEIFQEKKLRASQETDNMVRGEWAFGVAGFNVQVYFDKRKGHMPVLCRYVCPKNPNEKFAKKGKIVFNEIETSWGKLKEGFVPTRIRNLREQIASEGEVVRVTRSQLYDFDWKSNLADPESVFETPGKKQAVTSQAFNDSFSSK